MSALKELVWVGSSDDIRVSGSHPNVRKEGLGSDPCMPPTIPSRHTVLLLVF